MVAKEQVGARKIGGGFFGSLFGGGEDELPAEGDSEESDGKSKDMLADMLGLEKRISRQQDLIAKQSTTIMRLRDAGAPAEEIEREQRTLEKMKVGLQGLLRSFSFSQVEAKTTMVKAATEIQEMAEEAGVDAGPIEGFMRNIFGKKATSAAVGAADSVLDSILDALKPNRSRAEEGEGDVEEEPSAPESTKDPEELRRRMDDIKSEMILVAEQMAEMERRLLEQQADLESRQRELERGAGAGVDDGFLSEEADGEGRVLKKADGKPIAKGDIADIEETKREIEEALSRIDKMQSAQKDLTE